MSYYNGAYRVKPIRRNKPSKFQGVCTGLVGTCECGAFLVGMRNLPDPNIFWPKKCDVCGKSFTPNAGSHRQEEG
jgi:hypothetical protein